MKETSDTSSLKLRPLQSGDYEKYHELEKRCYKHMEPYDREMYLSRIEQFPEGQLGIFYDSRLVGASNSLIVDIHAYGEEHTWSEIADEGYIRNHDPEGDTLYGIEIFIDPEFRNMKLGRRFYNARKELCRKLNLKRIMIAGRLPGYHNYAQSMTVAEYVEAVMEKRIYDPVLTFQVSNNFSIKKLIKNYLKGDEQSKEYAALMEWINLNYEETEAPQPTDQRSVTAHPVRICAIQYQMRKINGWDDFKTQIEYFVDVSSEYKSDFVLFPELLTTQLLSYLDEKRPGPAARELTRFTDQYIELFRRLSMSYNVNIIGGSHFIEEEQKVYNASYIFRRDGTYDKQYKIHITPNERQIWGIQGGDQVKIFDTDRGRIAILICYDIEFPELARIATEKGAKIIFVPYSTDERQGFMRVRICSQARCIENQVYTAMAGTTGNIPSVENMSIQYAQSAIFTPSDYPFSRDGIASIADVNVETVILSDLDLQKLEQARLYGTVRPLKDRRTDLYSINYESKITGKTISDTINKG